MNIRVTHLRLKPGCLDPLKKVYTHDLLPILRSQPGFLFAYLFQEAAEDGKECLSVTGWDCRGDFDYFIGSPGSKEYAEKVRPFVDTSTPRKTYDMTAGGDKT